MTTEQTEERAINVEVKSVATVEGRFGPQWQCQIVLQGISEFEKRAWINDANAQTDNNRVFHPRALDQPVPGTTYPCIVRRGDLTKDRDGNLHDGSRDYHYNWKIVEFDTDRQLPAAAPAQVTAAAPSAAGQPSLLGTDERQRLIVQQNVLNRATDIYIARMDEYGHQPYATCVLAIANALWAILPTIGAAATETPSDAPESDVAPDDGSDDEIDAMLTPPAPRLAHKPMGKDPNEGEQMPWRDEEAPR
jgi:hypothetical protein